MVTHYPQIASGETIRPRDDDGEDIGIGARVKVWLREAYCGLHGHDNLLHFEKDRMALQCASCGHQTPGWELHEAQRPAVRVRTETRRPVLRPRLVSARRIA
jgi:hypothetical protein